MLHVAQRGVQALIVQAVTRRSRRQIPTGVVKGGGEGLTEVTLITDWRAARGCSAPGGVAQRRTASSRSVAQRRAPSPQRCTVSKPATLFYCV